MPVLILSLAIFLIFGVVASLVLLNLESKKKKRAMQIIKGDSSLEIKARSKSSAQDQRRTELAKKLQSTNALQNKKKGALVDKLMQSGMKITVRQYWLFSVLSAIVCVAVAKLFGRPDFVLVMAFIIGLLGVPRFILNHVINKRQKAFMNDFADALESMMRLLKAGMPVSEAIRMVANEYSGPMGEEMSRVYDQQKIGVPLPEALLDMARRMPLTEMQMFATAIAIQTQTGSSLSEVLQNLAGVIRSRFKLKRKVKALSQEAKSSAMIIGALPVIVASGMYFINRDYIEVLFVDPTGKFLLGCAIGWMCVGIIVMKQMINFKV